MLVIGTLTGADTGFRKGVVRLIVKMRRFCTHTQDVVSLFMMFGGPQKVLTPKTHPLDPPLTDSPLKSVMSAFWVQCRTDSLSAQCNTV